MIPTLILLIALVKFLPESPVRLLKEGDENEALKKNDEREALKSLQFFQNEHAAVEQLDELQREVRNKRLGDREDLGCMGLIRSVFLRF